MTSTILSMALTLAMGSTGGLFDNPAGMRVAPPGPGNGWGFPNGNHDGYGWHDFGTDLPLGADRDPEYYVPRYLIVPPEQMFMPTYYNPYVSRGQRYVPYANCGGWHPMGGPPQSSADLPMHPYNDTIGSGPQVRLPNFSGRIAAPPVNAGNTGLTP
jgi:hypothetical protein